jgi:sphingomyelin phosphodiesterase acid-like 3
LISICKSSRWRVTFWLWVVIPVLSALASGGETPSSSYSRDGQWRRSAQAADEEDHIIPAILVSDIHFDPFHDPARVQQLVAAPANRWRSILMAPPAPNQQQAFAALQQSCHARGVDTPYTLLQSSLQAMRTRQRDAKFITVSGDLIAHSFSCRYATLFPGSSPSDYQAFVLKTLDFLIGELRASFSGVPVYVALGNNDTGCGDYRLDAGSDFLVRAGRIVEAGLPPAQQQQALKDFAKGGYFSVTMEAPMHNTVLIVINDLFLSPKYSTCAGGPDATAAITEMAWLEEQLARARRSGQRAWVMGHIPPGVDLLSTVVKMKDICGNGAPEMFLSSDKLSDLLIEYADVIRLAIFAHTHMDEMRLLEARGGASHASLEHSVAIKVVPSISPVDGNNPSFTAAFVNPFSAALQDYEVIAASNQTGVDTTWSREYDYAQTYHEAQFSPSTVKELIAKFENDQSAKTDASEEYIRNYYVGDRSPELKPFWSQYICALGNHTAKAFAACVCSARK